MEPRWGRPALQHNEHGGRVSGTPSNAAAPYALESKPQRNSQPETRPVVTGSAAKSDCASNAGLLIG